MTFPVLWFWLVTFRSNPLVLCFKKNGDSGPEQRAPKQRGLEPMREPCKRKDWKATPWRAKGSHLLLP